MTRVRFLSTRAPYRRGGLVFDHATPQASDGRRVIEMSRSAAELMGEDNFRQLVEDPAITVELAMTVGPEAIDVEAARAARANRRASARAQS